MNRIKEFYNDKYGMLITLSWILLIICLVIKLFGGNLFELGTDNEKFIAFCNYVDNHQWLKMILACLMFCTSGYLSLCVSLNTNKMNVKQLIIFVPLMILKSILNWYFKIIPFILDVLTLLIIPIILTKKIIRPIICVILVLLFQIITLTIRNLNVGLNDFNSFVEQSLIQIDYYLMIILYYLYNTKKIRKEAS